MTDKALIESIMSVYLDRSLFHDEPHRWSDSIHLVSEQDLLDVVGTLAALQMELTHVLSIKVRQRAVRDVVQSSGLVQESVQAPRLLTLAEAAVLLHLGSSTLRTQVRRGNLAATLVGKVWRVTPDEVERYRAESKGRVGRPRKGA